MAKTVTLRLDDEIYQKIRKAAEADKRSLSNFIEYAAMAHLMECAFVEVEEMEEISSSSVLLKKLKRGTKEAKKKKGKFVA